MEISVETQLSLSTLHLDQLLVYRPIITGSHSFYYCLSLAAPSDFTSDPVTVTFTAGQTVATASVPIIDDPEVEDTEMFNATLSTTDSNVAFGQDTATVTILDNDGIGV